VHAGLSANVDPDSSNKNTNIIVFILYYPSPKYLLFVHTSPVYYRPHPEKHTVGKARLTLLRSLLQNFPRSDSPDDSSKPECPLYNTKCSSKYWLVEEREGIHSSHTYADEIHIR